jgi:hypothetical protein
LNHKNEHDCQIDPDCGWCIDKKRCLTARSDRKADLCKFCTRCNFFYHARDNQREECLEKNSCGWCDTDKICYPGDDLGPFV